MGFICFDIKPPTVKKEGNREEKKRSQKKLSERSYFAARKGKRAGGERRIGLMQKLKPKIEKPGNLRETKEIIVLGRKHASFKKREKQMEITWLRIE